MRIPADRMRRKRLCMTFALQISAVEAHPVSSNRRRFGQELKCGTSMDIGKQFKKHQYLHVHESFLLITVSIAGVLLSTPSVDNEVESG